MRLAFQHASILAVLGLLFTSSVTLHAQESREPQPSPSTAPSTPLILPDDSPDKRFLRDVARGNLLEMELGKLAAQKASHPKVRQFGQQMADDHSMANGEVKSMALMRHITLPDDLDAKRQGVLKRLSALSGAALDKAYMQAVVADHQADIAAFQKEANEGADRNLKAWATEVLPSLQDHLRQAQDTLGAVGK